MMQVQRNVARLSPESAASLAPEGLVGPKYAVSRLDENTNFKEVANNMAAASVTLQAEHLVEACGSMSMALLQAPSQAVQRFWTLLAAGYEASAVADKPVLITVYEKPEGPTTTTCTMPPGAAEESLITQGDAKVSAHDVYTGIAIGGMFSDGSPNESGNIGGLATYKQRNGEKWNIKGGQKQEPLRFDWSQFGSLAKTAVSSSSGQYKVVVVTKGGTYSLYDFVPGGQGEDNGKTLVIFNTDQDVILTKTNDGRQFGPSVLAPFSKVTLQNDAGFIDGCLIAKTFTSGDGSLQMHGDCYKGTITCQVEATTAAPTTKAVTTGAPTTKVATTDVPTIKATTTNTPSTTTTDAPRAKRSTEKQATTVALTTNAPTADATTTDTPATKPPQCDALVDAPAFKEATSLCCPEKMEAFFITLLGCLGLKVCSVPHVQGLMHWFTCVPNMDFQYLLDVISDGNPCKYWAPISQACPTLSEECQGKMCTQPSATEKPSTTEEPSTTEKPSATSAPSNPITGWWIEKFKEDKLSQTIIDSLSTANYNGSNQWFVGGQPTGVGWGNWNSSCDSIKVFCAGGSQMGGHAAQAKAIEAAIANNGKHPQAP